MSRNKTGENTVNGAGTFEHTDAQVTRGRSGPVRYELVDKDGNIWKGGQFNSAIEAAKCAGLLWPGQYQDEDHTGNGWDVQVVGCDKS